MLAITIPGMSKVRYRCEMCAGEDAPDLPPRRQQEIQPRGQPMLPIRALVSSLPIDWKGRQTGEREPGEEG